MATIRTRFQVSQAQGEHVKLVPVVHTDNTSFRQSGQQAGSGIIELFVNDESVRNLYFTPGTTLNVDFITTA